MTSYSFHCHKHVLCSLLDRNMRYRLDSSENELRKILKYCEKKFFQLKCTEIDLSSFKLFQIKTLVNELKA